MVRITINGHGHEKVGKDLKHFFQTGQQKIVRHFKVSNELEIDDIGQCDIAIIEIEDKKEVRK